MASTATNLVLAVLVLSSSPAFSRREEVPEGFDECPPFHCGKLGNLTFPFANIAQHKKCGFFTVYGCNEEVQKFQFLPGTGNWYDLLDIYQNKTIHVRDPELARHLNSSNHCQIFNNLRPFYSVDQPFPFQPPPRIYPAMTLLKCNHTPNIQPPPHFPDFPCGKCRDYNIYYASKPLPDSLPESCSAFQLPAANQTGESSNECLHRIASDFFLELELLPDFCHQTSEVKSRCASLAAGNEKITRKLGIAIAFSAVLVGAIIGLLVYCHWIRSLLNRRVFFWKKRSLLNDKRVGSILKSNGSIAPKRYTYTEVKKITSSFKSMLGEGGCGRVYQGKLLDGSAVAVKVLKESKGSGEEFVNEVTSISRTSHVNIMTLIGFCFEGDKRALIYEFMPNGSLDKFIYNVKIESTARQLGWETLYQIAIGIARGLEYLHRGCNTRIVHFDIKPHNILLNEVFCPKIADFGLAKLCLDRKESILSMMGARGTPGYVAPEMFCRSIGGVSHKSDVYSYGMMVLEMVGGRKNIDIAADHTSEIYFPHWIHGRLCRGDEELELHGIASDEERVKARKMILVGLWCIQIDPGSRPPMHTVLEMFQDSLESLQIPPLPILSSSLKSSIPDSSNTRNL